MRLPQKSKNLQKKWKIFHKSELFPSFCGKTLAVLSVRHCLAVKNKKACFRSCLGHIQGCKRRIVLRAQPECSDVEDGSKNKKAERDNLLNCNWFKVAPQLSLGFCSLKPKGGSNAPFLCRDPSKKFEQENFVPSPHTAMLAYKGEQWKRILQHQSATATSSAISTRRSSTDLLRFPMEPCSQ